MGKSNFQKGQTVYLFIVKGSNAYRYVKSKPFEERIIPGTISSTSHGYITVTTGEWPLSVKFDVDTLDQLVDEGSADYMIFLSKQEIYDYVEGEKLYDKIANAFASSKNNGNISLEKLRKIAEILD